MSCIVNVRYVFHVKVVVEMIEFYLGCVKTFFTTSMSSSSSIVVGRLVRLVLYLELELAVNGLGVSMKKKTALSSKRMTFPIS